jgi:UDP-N-acetylmuramate dehydrogenase
VHDVTRADLSRHTTLRLGGAAGQLISANDQDEIAQTVLSTAGDLLILAGGSNVVIADTGFRGTVVLLRSSGMTLSPGGLLEVEAGQPWDDVVQLAVAEGFAGIECLSGVPGSAGATPIQNVGAYGQEVAEVIASVRVLDRSSGLIQDLGPTDCGFAYRTSLFKHNPRYVVLAVTFQLQRSPLSMPLRYAELARQLGVAPGDRAPLADVRAAVLALRAGKGMVLDPADPDTYSVGSFFVNPVLNAAEYAALRVRALELGGTEPASWPDSAGFVKVSAAWLIERAGFSKGYTGGHPGVGVSGKHTLALTNRGTGTTTALLALARDIRDGVRKVFDVDLHPEPVLINCSL